MSDILSSSQELRVVKYSNYSSLVLMRLIVITATVKLQCVMKMFVCSEDVVVVCTCFYFTFLSL